MVWAMVDCLSAFIWWYNIRIWYLGWMWLSFDGVTYQFGSWIGYSSYLVEWYPDLTSGMKDLRCIVLCKLFWRAKEHIGEFVWWIVWCCRASWGIRLLWICFEKLSQQFRLTAPCCDVCWTLEPWRWENKVGFPEPPFCVFWERVLILSSGWWEKPTWVMWKSEFGSRTDGLLKVLAIWRGRVIQNSVLGNSPVFGGWF